MKKFNLLVVCAIFSLTAQSQELRIGFKAGANIANLGGDGTEDFKGLLGIHFGSTFEIPVSDWFSAQPEIMYSSQGTRIKSSEHISRQGYDYEVRNKGKLHLHYLNVPVMAKLYLTDGLALEAGPQIGFMISARRKSEKDVFGDLPQEVIDLIKSELWEGRANVKDFIKTVDFAIGFGASYHLKEGIFIGARYNLGLSNVHKDSGDLENQNNVLQISAGYRF